MDFIRYTKDDKVTGGIGKFKDLPGFKTSVTYLNELVGEGNIGADKDVDVIRSLLRVMNSHCLPPWLQS